MRTYAQCSCCKQASYCTRVNVTLLCRECVRAFVALWSKEGMGPDPGGST